MLQTCHSELAFLAGAVVGALGAGLAFLLAIGAACSAVRLFVAFHAVGAGPTAPGDADAGALPLEYPADPADDCAEEGGAACECARLRASAETVAREEIQRETRTPSAPAPTSAPAASA